MRVAVVGATGTAGGPIAAELERLGHDVRRLSRSSETYPVDLTSGEGLDGALEGCDSVVDASNAAGRIKKTRALLVHGGERLLAAEARAGVGHHVCLSIIGIDRVPIGYYGVKQEQEQTVRDSGVPWTVLRATQFHQLVDWAFSSIARARVLPRVGAPLQPIDPVEVAALAAEIATSEPRREIETIAGPRIEPITDLARSWKAANGARALLLPFPLLGQAGIGLRAGGLTDPSPDHSGTTTFESWLASRSSRR